MSERSIELLLLDIKESINNILSFTNTISFADYCSDIKTKHAVQHYFMIIGEAVSRIASDYKAHYNHINWRQVKDFRNVVVHDYFGLDDNIIWDIIKFNLPQLLEDISVLYNNNNMGV
jgi:uncharacterized protein with HEPN domain